MKAADAVGGAVAAQQRSVGLAQDWAGSAPRIVTDRPRATRPQPTSSSMAALEQTPVPGRDKPCAEREPRCVQALTSKGKQERETQSEHGAQRELFRQHRRDRLRR